MPDGDRRANRFTTTQWSLVAAAADTGNPDCRAALAHLCEAYWYPIYAQVRQSGQDPDTAQDLTQGFFTHLLEKHSFKIASPDRGRFRAFLKTSLRNFMTNEWHREAAEKRGGGKTPISLDFEDAESRFKREPVEPRTPEREFEKRWARALLGRALQNLRDSARDAADKRRLERLEPYLTGQAGSASYRQTAADLDMTEAAVKVAVHRLRRRFGELLRAAAAPTVNDPEEIDDEIRYLFSIIDS